MGADIVRISEGRMASGSDRNPPVRRTERASRCTPERLRGGMRQTMAMNSRRLAWLFAITFWTLFGIVTGIQVWISMITHGHSILRLVGYYLAVSEAWLLPSVVIVRLARGWPVIPP